MIVGIEIYDILCFHFIETKDYIKSKDFKNQDHSKLCLL